MTTATEQLRNKLVADADAGLAVDTATFLKVAVANRSEREAADRGRAVAGRWTIDYTEYDPAVFCDRPVGTPRWYATAFVTGYPYGDGAVRVFGGQTRQEVELQIQAWAASEAAHATVRKFDNYAAWESRRR